ncbi:adenylate/guanylate cyclase domain-containing protein [Sneathiella sp.]|jgi:adenylate cyclase|uniref:adenylate/guanylate cyclase domain-containing protein n=1 Tax=Sneathiella sp. TaxID=1964365 RepID=UPI0039E58BA6
MTTSTQRKLTTILCADVVGYSRLMGQDEEGTLARLKKARTLFTSNIADYSGRVINLTGDAVIAEFGSVVQAVQFAAFIQESIHNESQKTNDPEALFFRIGLNLGDVIIEGNDIFGDGVNVAARLEALAPTGGVCLSGTVYDHVKGKLNKKFTYLGQKEVKNIENTIDVYVLEVAGAAKPNKIPDPKIDRVHRSSSTEDTDRLEEEKIRKYVRRQAAFYRRAFFTGALIIFLLMINLITNPSYFWFIWPAMPLLFMLSLDAMRVFGKGHWAENWEEKHVKRMKTRKGLHRSHSSSED